LQIYLLPYVCVWSSQGGSSPDLTYQPITIRIQNT
jgi:hypothetical protein